MPAKAQVHSNPYLIDPKCDIAITDGQQLTKIHPVFMTRLIAELPQKKYNEARAGGKKFVMSIDLQANWSSG